MAEQGATPQPCAVVQSVCGAFHHFNLARELHRRGYLKAIYSTFPWQRLKRENLPHGLVHTFPWLQTPQVVLSRWWDIPAGVNREINWRVAVTLDAWVERHLPPCDVFVGISGVGLKTGRRAQSRGAKYVCDRGSAHIRAQDQILKEEYARWGVPHKVVVDPRIIAREEAEYAQADAITVPSEFARRSFVEMGVPPEKLHKIPYGVELDRFRPVAEPAKDRFEVLFVGAVGLEKGVPYLLQAFAQVRHPRKRLRIVGGVRREMHEIFRRLPLEKVEFVGLVPQKQLPELMSSSHVMALPSVQDGFGMVLSQAMACGCPLITSTNTGGPDLIREGVEGFVVPIRSPEAIADRLQQLAEDPALREQMSESALAGVHGIGGWHEYGEGWVELTTELLRDAANAKDEPCTRRQRA